MLSMLSELDAAKIVIPLRIVTTISVLRLVVRKVLRFAAFKASSTFCLSGNLHVIHIKKFLNIYKVNLSRNLDKERITPDNKTGTNIALCPVIHSVPPTNAFNEA